MKRATPAAKAAVLRKIVGYLIKGYPDGEWEQLLHEEGCPGGRIPIAARDCGDQCHCDGDYYVEEVKKHVPRKWYR